MKLEARRSPAYRLAYFLFTICVLAPTSAGCQDTKQDTAPAEVAIAAKTARPTPEPQAEPKSEDGDNSSNDAELVAPFVPDWVADAIFYQIFPERFRNGDKSNDPTRESLESADVPASWAISPWTADWYSRSDWEQEIGDNFYESGVFHRRYGGDLQGVLDKLDYLQSLGINAIYFNPVFYARSLHKYDGSSMHHVDPYFGPDPEGDFEIMASETSDPKTWQWTAADKLFLQLIEQLHRRSIRVIIDGVFNHTGRDFFAFADLIKNQEKSPYKQWYIVQHLDNPATPNNEFRYKSWWGFETLPEFADNASRDDLHPGPKQYVFDITRRWMDPNGDGNPVDGIDGWRLDVANEVPPKFWKDWNTLVRKLNPQAYTVGEFWDNARDHLVNGRFSGSMNYHGFAFLVKGFLIDGRLTAHDFGRQLEQRLQEYPEPMQFALQNLIDSHDTDRLASMIVNSNDANYRQPDRYDFDVSEVVSPRSSAEYKVSAPNQRQRRIQKLVALMQMTYLGAPMIYYGTEAGMWGADDPCDRMPMVWNDLEYDDQTSDPLGRPRSPDPVTFHDELFKFYQSVVKLRLDTPALRRAPFELVAHDDAAQFLAFRRKFEGHSLLVAINRGEEDFHWSPTAEENVPRKPIYSASGGERSLDQAELQTTNLIIPALDAVVFAEMPTNE